MAGLDLALDKRIVKSLVFLRGMDCNIGVVSSGFSHELHGLLCRVGFSWSVMLGSLLWVVIRWVLHVIVGGGMIAVWDRINGYDWELSSFYVEILSCVLEFIKA